MGGEGKGDKRGSRRNRVRNRVGVDIGGRGKVGGGCVVGSSVVSGG